LWRRDPVDLVTAGSCEECKASALQGHERSKTEKALSPTQEFAIDRKSIKFVAEERAYAISGNVTGPGGGQARIRVWLGDPSRGCKLRDPILGSETLVSASLVVDLPEGNNVFSLILEEYQLPANVPLPPDSAHPWVVTASAVWGEAESDPVLLPTPVYACREIVSSTQLSVAATEFEIDGQAATLWPKITDPPFSGVTVRSGATYEIKGVQASSFSSLLIEATPVADGERVASGSFATVLEPGETEFSVLVKLDCDGANSFVVRATDLNSGVESALVAVPKIIRRQSPRVGAFNR
jgi:hypothetical protein